MRIFLSSTAYDIQDLRDLTVARLHEAGHDVIHFESPVFPVFLEEHSHDQCLLSIPGCDLMICILDRRYGGKYAGRFTDRFPNQKILIRNETKEKETRVIETESLSATWCEIIEARRLGIRVMTFARQTVMNEKETRRENWHVKDFRTKFADSERVFDLLDWTTQQNTGNWIIQYRNIAEYEDKLIKWVKSYSAAYVSAHPTNVEEPASTAVTPSPTEPTPTEATTPTNITGALTTSVPAPEPADDSASPIICVLCEGSTDVFIVKQIVEQLELPARTRIIPMHGSGNSILRALQGFIEGLRAQFDSLVVLTDSDTWDDSTIAAAAKRLEAALGNSYPGLATFTQAVPSIESWVIAGMAPDTLLDMRSRHAPEQELKAWIQRNRSSGGTAFPSLKGWSLSTARSVSPDLEAFISALQRASTHRKSDSRP